MDEHFTLMMTAVGGMEKADAIASALVRERLAACVQLTPVKSHYVWNGAQHADDEILLLIKTRAAQQAEIERRIKAMSDYELPEITAVPIEFASAEYGRWITKNTG